GPIPPSTPSTGSLVVILVDLVRRGLRAVVGVERLLDGAVDHEAASVEIDAALAEARQLGLAVGHQHERAPLGEQVVDHLVALLLELAVAHRERLVDQQDRVGQPRDQRERQPDPHPGGVVADRGVDRVDHLLAGEGDDLVELVADLLLAQPVQRGDEVDVLPPREVAGEPGRQLDQGRHLAADHHLALVGLEHTGHEPQQGALARAVAADDAHRLPGVDPEGHVAQRPERLLLDPPAVAAEGVDEHLPEAEVATPVADELDAEIADLDDRLGHYSSLSTAGSRRRNNSHPATRVTTLPVTHVRSSPVDGKTCGNQAEWWSSTMPTSGFAS